MYSDEQKEIMFNHVIKSIESGLSLRAALIQTKVSRTIFESVLNTSEDKKAQYARARDERADRIFEEILEIADESNKDTLITDNGITINSEFVQRSRLRIDARKWYLSKMLPKKFGDKVENTIVGDNEKPIIINLGSGIDPKNEQSQ
jgi:hypothetical protein